MTHKQYKKIRDLCIAFPKRSNLISAFDNIAASIFTQSGEKSYVMSSAEVESRYNLPIDNDLLKKKNDFVKDFDLLGPNEKYIINKIFFSSENFIYIIGGIGVGKTTFTNYFINEIVPKIQIPSSHHPLIILYDFLEYGTNFDLEKENKENITNSFSRTLLDAIYAKIINGNYFTRDEEIFDVWNEIISNYKKKKRVFPQAINFLMKKLHVKDAYINYKITNKDLERIKEERKNLMEEISNDTKLFTSYLSVLINFISEKYYSESPISVIIIVDNVDRESDLVQIIIKTWLKSFVHNCKCKLILNARQTTYYKHYGDNLSKPVDVIPFNGPSPFEVIRKRLEYVINDHKEFEMEYEKSFLESIMNGINHLLQNHLTKPVIKDFISSLCGHSIRKALILSQHLIFNSVYNIARDYLDINTGDIQRAILVGPNAYFKSSPNSIICNLFEVESPTPPNSYLVKPRILSLLLDKNKGLALNKVYDILNGGFNYTDELLITAINELKNMNKRLIWSDIAYNELKMDAFSKIGSSRIYITTAGKGYVNYLIKDITYIQEVMLDTTVLSTDFGSDWDYGNIIHRFKLLYKFLNTLVDEDMREMKIFIENYGIEEFTKNFRNSAHILTYYTVLKIIETSKNIFKSIKSRQSIDSHDFEIFTQNHLLNLENLKLKIENFETKYGF